MAWILGVNNVYHDVLPPLTIEIPAVVFFVLLSFRKLQLQLVHYSTGESWYYCCCVESQNLVSVVQDK